MRKINRNKGTTLIELITSIAIMSIIFSICLPTIKIFIESNKYISKARNREIEFTTSLTYLSNIIEQANLGSTFLKNIKKENYNLSIHNFKYDASVLSISNLLSKAEETTGNSLFISCNSFNQETGEIITYSFLILFEDNSLYILNLFSDKSYRIKSSSLVIRNVKGNFSNYGNILLLRIENLSSINRGKIYEKTYIKE